MPFDRWHPYQPSVLPGGYAVYGLDHEQIVLHDVDSERIGVLARGRSPVVVLDW